MYFPIRTFVILLFLAGVLALQFFLSRARSRWPGLILPILAFLFSLLFPLNTVSFHSMGVAANMAEVLIIWLIANIPTAILLAIYFAVRSRRKNNSEVDKTKIEDL